MESIPGFRGSLSISEFRMVLEKVGCAFVGRAEESVPADCKIRTLRDATAVMESVPRNMANILSQKLREDPDARALDVKAGNCNFRASLEDAFGLAQNLVTVASSSGAKT